jgi:ubiquitin fusion degradation protein 1
VQRSTGISPASRTQRPSGKLVLGGCSSNRVELTAATVMCGKKEELKEEKEPKEPKFQAFTGKKYSLRG